MGSQETLCELGVGRKQVPGQGVVPPPVCQPPQAGPAPTQKEGEGAAGTTQEEPAPGGSPLGAAFPGPREGEVAAPHPHSVPRPQHLITPVPQASLAPQAASPAAQPPSQVGLMEPPPQGPAIIQNRGTGPCRGPGYSALSAQVTCLFRVLTWTLRGVLRLKGQSRLTHPPASSVHNPVLAHGVSAQSTACGDSCKRWSWLSLADRKPTQRRAGLSKLCWREHHGGVMGDPKGLKKALSVETRQ